MQIPTFKNSSTRSPVLYVWVRLFRASEILKSADQPCTDRLDRVCGRSALIGLYQWWVGVDRGMFCMVETHLLSGFWSAEPLT
jgi:hypothetical protein